MSCQRMNSPRPYYLTDIHPDFANVDNGGNNLASPHSPPSVADAVVTVEKNILNIHHARHVTVCSALYRTKAVFTRATFGLFVARHRDWRRRPTPKPLSRRLSAEVEHVPMLGKK